MLLPTKTYIISGLVLSSICCAQSHSETYNVITVSRVTKNTDYRTLGKEQRKQIFDKLEELFPKKESKSLNTNKANMKNEIDINNKTLICFNESFFGAYEPLKEKAPANTANEDTVENISNEIKKITEEYNNVYCFVNFLYTRVYDSKDDTLLSQIDTSKQRYQSILDNEKQSFYTPSIETNAIIKDDEDGESLPTSYSEEEIGYFGKMAKDPTEKDRLLLNQTKIFCQGKEVGYYNKSSFMEERTKIKDYYYIIGNFGINWNKQTDRLPVRCLTCYDVSVFTQNSFYKNYKSDSIGTYGIILFSSNPYSSLPVDIQNIGKDIGSEISNRYCVCANGGSKYQNDQAILKAIEEKDDVFLNGVYKISDAKPVAEEKDKVDLELNMGSKNIVKICEKSLELKTDGITESICHIKVFTLTIDK